VKFLGAQRDAYVEPADFDHRTENPACASPTRFFGALSALIFAQEAVVCRAQHVVDRCCPNSDTRASPTPSALAISARGNGVWLVLVS
jgi:hypothetical protein